MRIAVLAAIAAAFVILGLSLGLATGSATGANGKAFSCGSPWNADIRQIEQQQYIDDLANSMVGREVWKTDYRQRCADALGTRGAFAWVTLGAGVLLLIGAAVTYKPQASPAEPAEPADNA